MDKIAVLFQAHQAPLIKRQKKPFKEGGYADSGADIAYTLRQASLPIITPVEDPDIRQDLDWVFPDTEEGISAAHVLGAKTFWLNTVLYGGHPVEKMIDKGLAVVGQVPKMVEVYDDKLLTNNLLKKQGLSIPDALKITKDQFQEKVPDVPFPAILKPIRGRGSQGVSKVNNKAELSRRLKQVYAEGKYGDIFYIEAFLPGEEITITVMPPGKYLIDKKETVKDDYWCLPPLRRFNHIDGVVPYSGLVAVSQNSSPLTKTEVESGRIRTLCSQCELAAKFVNAKAPIRIDCRAGFDDSFFLFDLNMKPNITGTSRPHRGDQESLTAMSARAFGWSYSEFLINILNQRWTLRK